MMRNCLGVVPRPPKGLSSMITPTHRYTHTQTQMHTFICCFWMWGATNTAGIHAGPFPWTGSRAGTPWVHCPAFLAYGPTSLTCYCPGAMLLHPPCPQLPLYPHLPLAAHTSLAHQRASLNFQCPHGNSTAHENKAQHPSLKSIPYKSQGFSVQGFGWVVHSYLPSPPSHWTE